MRHARSRRSGFSLVELMIAIMILGLGMVMVATVFPVSLDLTRTTLQMSMTNAAMEAAVTTLRMKLPSRKPGLEPLPADTSAEVVLWPDVRTIELDDAVIDAADYAVEYAADAAGATMLPQATKVALVTLNSPNLDLTDPLNVMEPLLAAHWQSTWGAFLTPILTPAGPRSRARLLTEQTYWDAEMHDAFRNCSWLIPSVNIGSNDGMPFSEANALPYIQHPDFKDTNLPVPRSARIHLADRVYPPVELEADGVGRYLDPSTINPATGQPLPFPNPSLDEHLRYVNTYVAQAARERRYAWTAFARQGGNDLHGFNIDRSFLATIVLTFRGDLNARYARQILPADDAQFNFADSSDPDFESDRGMMLIPQPDSPLTDTVFPQPWLVMLININASAGMATCSHEVAGLLPADSYMIVAQSKGPFQAGTSIKTTGRIVPDTNEPCTIQIPRSQGALVEEVAVWVFPPPIVNRNALPDMRFQGASPVVGVAIREIKPDWGN